MANNNTKLRVVHDTTLSDEKLQRTRSRITSLYFNLIASRLKMMKAQIEQAESLLNVRACHANDRDFHLWLVDRERGSAHRLALRGIAKNLILRQVLPREAVKEINAWTGPEMMLKDVASS